MHPEGENPLFPVFQAEPAFSAYQTVRPLLPSAQFPRQAEAVATLGDLADRFDAFVFDAYGVLNVGAAPIPGAVERVAALQAAGKTCLVMTNAASFDRAASFQKFARLGLTLRHDDIVTSRQAAEEAMAASGAGQNFAVLGLEPAEAGNLPAGTFFPADDPAAFDRADGFLFLSTVRWTAARQLLLVQSLRRRSRPVVIANPDMVAPREGDFSTEPGYFGYRLALDGLGSISFHGKPFPSVYALARRRHPQLGRGRRVLMVGDTLHTDILGAAAQGWSTALVTGHGLFRGVSIAEKIAQSGIVPDFILPTI